MRCQLVASSSPMTTHCRFNGNSLGIGWQLDGNSLVRHSGIPTGKLHWPIVGKPTPIKANDFHHCANEVLLSGLRGIMDWRLPDQPHAESHDRGDTVRGNTSDIRGSPKALYSAPYYFFAILMTYQLAYHLTSVCLPMTACSTGQYILNKMPSSYKKI